MANLRDIRKRIKSVKSTQQVTKAMKMIAAVKLRKAQAAIVAMRPYAFKTYEVLSDLAAKNGNLGHSLLRVKEEKEIKLVLVTSDRGLCGSFNSSLIRTAEKFIQECKNKNVPISIDFIGRKGYDYFKNKTTNVGQNFTGIIDSVSYPKAALIGDKIIDYYEKGPFGKVLLLYNEFKSVLSQRNVIETLLPIVTGQFPHKESEASIQKDNEDYIYEPSRREVLENLLPRHVKIQIFRALSESVASEQGARMTSMDNATRNAGDMIKNLTLTTNKLRQSMITQELIEIITGAQAL